MHDSASLEFPLPRVCQWCMATNLTKTLESDPQGATCRICSRNFATFEWKTREGKWMRTLLCSSCSQAEEACQVCTLDLEFGISKRLKAYALQVIDEEGGSQQDPAVVQQVLSEARDIVL